MIKERFGYTLYGEILEGDKVVFEKMQKYAADFQDVIEMKRAFTRKIADISFPTQSDDTRS